MQASSLRRLREQIAVLPGVVEGESAFGPGVAYWVDGREVAHFHGDAELELRLTRRQISALRPRLRADDRVLLRKGTSDWLAVSLADESAAELAVELAMLAVQAHLPPDGVALREPPTGADLERRRRFH